MAEAIQDEDNEKIEEKSCPLHSIIRTRNIHKMKIVLSSIKDINAPNDTGFPPLLYACEQENNDEMLELLFEHTNIDPYATDAEGQTALHILAFHGQLIWIKKFFEKFFFMSVDAVSSRGNTPLIMAVQMGHLDIIEFLLEKGANVKHKNDKDLTALHYAASNGYTRLTKKLLEHGADVNEIDDWGHTPLRKACTWNFLDTVKVLLHNGADVNITDILGDTPLTVVTRRKYFQIADVLLQNGAYTNNPKKSLYHEVYYTPIINACRNSDVEMLKLLIKYKGDVNFPGNYSAALFCCIRVNFIDGVEQLIRAGVDLYGRSDDNFLTPLEQARKLRLYKIIALIEEHFL